MNVYRIDVLIGTHWDANRQTVSYRIKAASGYNAARRARKQALQWATNVDCPAKSNVVKVSKPILLGQ